MVVRFSRSRKRYERQGILAEIAAIEKPERECAEDADERAAARVRGAEQRRKEDGKLLVRMTERIGELFPGCPPQELAAIAEHTSKRGSGRVGRTQAGRNLEDEPLIAAVRAAVRQSIDSIQVADEHSLGSILPGISFARQCADVSAAFQA